MRLKTWAFGFAKQRTQWQQERYKTSSELMASAKKKKKKKTTSYFKTHQFKTPVTFSSSRFSASCRGTHKLNARLQKKAFFSRGYSYKDGVQSTVCLSLD